MLRRSEFKKRGKSAFYRNWKSCIAICFIFTILVGGTIVSFNKSFELNPSDINYLDNIKYIRLNRINADTNSEIVNEFITGVMGKEPKENIIFNNATRGVIGTISNNVSKSGSYLFGVLNAINQVLFKDRIWASVIIIVGAILSLIYWIFVSKVLEVARARFFLESRKYTKTKANKLAWPYRVKRTLRIAWAMLIKNIYNILWHLTIVGGFIKYYAYILVPFIMAENPNIKAKDAIKLSEDMMRGYKWEFFKLDLSFIGWFLLDLITFNISSFVFTTPYKNATYAEVYMYLRDLSRTKGIENIELLNDVALEGELVFHEYPLSEYHLKEKKSKWLSFNYKRDYGFWNLILLFFIFSIVGWLWEVLFHLFQYGSFVNRGTLYGPWLPIYGGGGLAMLVLLKPLRKNPIAFFVLSMVVCGIIEYSTSVYLELVHNMAWWNYNGYFLNINGRICLEGLMLFGIGGLLATYIAAPAFASFLDKMNKNLKIALCVILTIIIAFDFYASGKNPNTGVGISTEIGIVNIIR
ncbi:MAG: DUF975 family protein [Bacilli bacterium]|nr:DUF975 family protein [Bacilli bacterium]